MKRITATIKDGTMKLDFDGFFGNTCEKELDTMNAWLGKVGIATETEYSEIKEEPEANRVAERVSNGH